MKGPALQDQATSQASVQRFVERVSKHGTVWGLQDREGGWAAVRSNATDADVIVFWSDRAYAGRCTRDEWHEYTPTPIPLPDFLDAWLPGMHEDGKLAGVNWDGNLCGLEIEPLQLGERFRTTDV